MVFIFLIINKKADASRTPPISGLSDKKVWLRCVLDEVRMYFGQNPQDFDE